MEHWTDAQWRGAEWRDPTRTYVEPEVTPLLRDPAGRWAVGCVVLATLVAALGAWQLPTWLEPPVMPASYRAALRDGLIRPPTEGEYAAWLREQDFWESQRSH